MISQFFILSPRGDTVITRDYLGNVPKGSSEVFYRKVKFWDGEGQDAPPVFHVDGVNYLHVKDGGVLLVATTRDNVSPSLVLELLRRVGGIIKDYCGLLSEEAVRKNFVLIYELLDEVIDYGYPQNSSSEALKEFVLNEPTILKPRKAAAAAALFNTVGKGPTGVIKSVLDTQRTDGGRRDEIFVDIVERISCTFNQTGYVTASQIDGAIQVKSYLAGNPGISLALNDNLAIGRREGGASSQYGGGHGSDVVMLDDCNFHESVSLDRFDSERTLELKPPDGEFALMNYRSTYDFRPPFKVYTTIEEDRDAINKAVIFIKVRADFSADKAAAGLEVVVPMPREVLRVSCEYEQDVQPIGNQTWDWQEKQHRLVWKHKKMKGNTEWTLRVRATLEETLTNAVRQGVGPINLNFTIPMYCASRLQVRYLQILKQDKNQSPYRWVRLPMNQSLVARQPIGSAHCAPSAHWRSRTSRRPLLSRHVINKQPVIGNTRLRKGSTGICCQQTAVSELEDVDPVTGEIVSGVKSKFPKQTLTAGGLEWAYRRSPAESDAPEKQQAVLLLHGIGSASYCFRETCALLDKAGYTAVAADWPGHGGSSKPDPSQFDYSQKSYLQALDAFVDQVGLQQPFHLIVQGFILGQYAMLWALSNPDKVDKLVVLNTPVGRKSKLRPELAAYKTKIAMFRPDPKKKRFDGANFNAAGGAYQMQGTVAAGYDWPYQEPGPASVAVAETMNQVDFQALLAEVNDACKSWRKPTLFLFGQNDPFIDIKTVFDFVEDKRTNFSLKPSQSRMGHMPQEDYPELLQETITQFLQES